MSRALDYTRTFGAVLLRDLYVTGRDLWSFLAQVLLQPLFMLLVFGHVITAVGFASPGYANLLFPGMVAFTAVLTGVQGTGLPLAIDFAAFKEIEDRLLAPFPLGLVALEKVVFGMLRGVLAAAAVYPVGWLVLDSVPVRPAGLPLLVLVIALGALTGSALGLVLGTWVPPEKINLLFAVLLPPLLFTGASQYPWPALAALPWLQTVSLFNPLTYVSEAARAASLADVEHLPVWLCLTVLTLFLCVLAPVGLAGFRRRVLD
ncbi:ABC transporter permease [Crossiella sp. NPDC003009]